AVFCFHASRPWTKVSRERFRPISRSDQRTPAGVNARELAALGACLGLLSAPAVGAVDRARPARHDAARPGVARPHPPSPGSVHGVRANGSTADAGVFARVDLHLGDAHALRRPTAARYRPALPAQLGPHARWE